MKMYNLSFYEVEHQGDLENVLEDISSCGGIIIKSNINYEAEIAVVEFKVSSWENFRERFLETESSEFIN